MWSQHREQRRADSWGSLASQPSLPGKLQANDKVCLINKESEGQKLGLHMHVHTHAHVYTYKRRKEERERKGKSRSCSFIQCLGFQCEAREMLDNGSDSPDSARSDQNTASHGSTLHDCLSSQVKTVSIEYLCDYEQHCSRPA